MAPRKAGAAGEWRLPEAPQQVSSQPLMRPEGAPQGAHPRLEQRGTSEVPWGFWILKTMALIFRVPNILGSHLWSLPCRIQSPPLPPDRGADLRSQIRSSSPWPLVGALPSQLPGRSRHQNRIQLQHPHRCQLEQGLCNGFGSPDSNQTELKRVGFSLFLFLLTTTGIRCTWSAAAGVFCRKRPTWTAAQVKALSESTPPPQVGLGALGWASSVKVPSCSPEVARRHSLRWPEVQAQGAWRWLPQLDLCFLAKDHLVETVGFYPTTLWLLLATNSLQVRLGVN